MATPHPPAREGCEEPCRGCAHRGWSAAASQAQKEEWLRGALEPWRAVVAPIRAPAPEQRWSYRRKVCLSAAWNGGAWSFGLRAGACVVAIPRCPVHDAGVNAAAQILAAALPGAAALPLAYYLQAGAQVTLVVKSREPPAADWWNPELEQRLAAAGVEGLWLNAHPGAGRRVLGSGGWRLLWGQPRSRDESGLLHGPAAFQQQIPALHEQALDQAEQYLQPGDGDAVADLYCGIGASLRRWRRRGASVLGVELMGEAVECARFNAPGAEVLQGRCGERLPQLQAWARLVPEPRRFLFLNPPRTGLEPGAASWIGAAYRPRRLAYLSCSAGTLRRDLETLAAAGYQVVRVVPYDFFPQTLHVEALALLALPG